MQIDDSLGGLTQHLLKSQVYCEWSAPDDLRRYSITTNVDVLILCVGHIDAPTASSNAR